MMKIETLDPIRTKEVRWNKKNRRKTMKPKSIFFSSFETKKS